MWKKKLLSDRHQRKLLRSSARFPSYSARQLQFEAGGQCAKVNPRSIRRYVSLGWAVVLENALNLLHGQTRSAYVVIIGAKNDNQMSGTTSLFRTNRTLSCFITIRSTSENIQMQIWIKVIALNIVHSLEIF